MNNLLEKLAELKECYGGAHEDKIKLNDLLIELRKEYRKNKNIFNQEIINEINDIKKYCYEIDNKEHNNIIIKKESSLINKKVKHIIFGDGIITGESNHRIVVKFEKYGVNEFVTDELRFRTLIVINNNKSIEELKLQSDDYYKCKNYKVESLECNLRLIYSNIRDLKYYIRAIEGYKNMNLIEEAKILAKEALKYHNNSKELFNYYQIFNELVYMGGHYKIKNEKVKSGSLNMIEDNIFYYFFRGSY